MARRELHFIWLLDTSGSMNSDGKIQALNVAIREAIPHLVSAARDNPNVDVRVRAMTFSDGARWHIETPTPVHDLKWIDVAAGGHTDTGTALKLLAQALKVPPMPERAVSPVLVLVTDGHHTDDFEAGLAALLAGAGAWAVRMAIAIGHPMFIWRLCSSSSATTDPPGRASHPEALVPYPLGVAQWHRQRVAGHGGRRLMAGSGEQRSGTVDDAVEW
jgi:uncharacterized protein YegL